MLPIRRWTRFHPNRVRLGHGELSVIRIELFNLSPRCSKRQDLLCHSSQQVQNVCSNHLAPIAGMTASGARYHQLIGYELMPLGSLAVFD
jgi:hypothetical protein